MPPKLGITADKRLSKDPTLLQGQKARTVGLHSMIVLSRGVYSLPYIYAYYFNGRLIFIRQDGGVGLHL